MKTPDTLTHEEQQQVDNAREGQQAPSHPKGINVERWPASEQAAEEQEVNFKPDAPRPRSLPSLVEQDARVEDQARVGKQAAKQP